MTVGNSSPLSGAEGLTVGNSSSPLGAEGLTVGNSSPPSGAEGLTVGNSSPPSGAEGLAVGNSSPPLRAEGLAVGSSSPPSGAEGLTVGNSSPPLGAEGLTVGNSISLLAPAPIHRRAVGLIFLIGYMGCGKSTKAKQLAHRLECPVIDLDAEIVTKSGKTIAEYFAEFGEDGFRNYESEMLKTFDYPKKCVIATGGGLPCFFDNMDWMNVNGETVYLQMEPAALVSRLHNRQKRPLIKDLDDEQLLEFIKAKLSERDPFYTKAKVIVDAFDLDAEKLEEAIRKI